MSYTLNQIVSIIDNNVRSGLAGSSNAVYSLDQLAAEVILYRNTVIEKIHQSPAIFNVRDFVQNFNVQLDRRYLNLNNEEIYGETSELHFIMPQPLISLKEDSILYVGPVSMDNKEWKVYFNSHQIKRHKYRMATANLPFVYVSDIVNEEGDVHCWVKNFTGTATELFVSVILSDPLKILDYDAGTEMDIIFPASNSVCETIIDNLTKKYLYYFRQLKQEQTPNDQRYK